MAQTGMKLSASLEDYLEAIYQVIADNGEARAKDIAVRLNVAASSVTNALRGLVTRKLVAHEPYDRITLTQEGEALAQNVVKRHETLTSFFTEVLSVDPETAEDCACKMEHIVGDVILERLIGYIEFSRRSDRHHTTWIEDKGFVHND